MIAPHSISLSCSRNSEVGDKVQGIEVKNNLGRSSMFVKSFNDVQFRDTGLNCSMSKSKVHRELDHM